MSEKIHPWKFVRNYIGNEALIGTQGFNRNHYLTVNYKVYGLDKIVFLNFFSQNGSKHVRNYIWNQLFKGTLTLRRSATKHRLHKIGTTGFFIIFGGGRNICGTSLYSFNSFLIVTSFELNSKIDFWRWFGGECPSMQMIFTRVHCIF